MPIAVLVAVHAVILWLWHTPGLYTWGLASVPAYWLSQRRMKPSRPWGMKMIMAMKMIPTGMR